MKSWFDDNDGVVGVSDLASFLSENENDVRRYARENGLRRIGSTFVFTLEDAEAYLAEWDVDGDDDDDDDDDEEIDDDDLSDADEDE